MKKYFFLLLLNFFIVASLKQAFATEWIKHDNNPIISSQAGFEQNSSSPTMIYDDNKYKMWYQAVINGKLCFNYAESEDGINWLRYENNPVFTMLENDTLPQTGIVEPSILKNELYRLWYNSQNNATYKIRYAFSSNGTSWTNHPDYVLIGEKTWESAGVANPSVVYKDGKYLMWYMGHGSSPWSIGYAESTDGMNWTKYVNNPLTLPSMGHVGGQSVIYRNGKFHMFYHTGGGSPTAIYHVVSENGINWSCNSECQILSVSSSGFDNNMVVYPEAIENGSNIYLYYSGFSSSIWQIGLATENPIQKDKFPIVLIPGFFASWNKNALLYNQAVDRDQWKINPFVHEYEGLIESLKNFGYRENVDFYIYNYDWRKGLNESADDLNSFLLTTSNLSDKKINIVGHSLGGLIGRIYAQKYGTEKINKLVAVGSPHIGVAQAYKVASAGEIERFDNIIWFSAKLLLQLYKDGIKTDKQIVAEKITVIGDLLPIYNFLQKNGAEIPAENMIIKNSTLLQYKTSFPNIYPVFSSIAGEKGDTLFGYKVKERTTMDKILNYYEDGRPYENIYKKGDYSVTTASANAGNDSKIIEFEHGELVYKKEAIKQILASFDISLDDNQIVEGQKTITSPSMIFLILSPATMKVTINGKTYSENDGLIFIENAENGQYLLEVLGKTKGQYILLIGQISTERDNWTKIDGSITSENPTDQTDSYYVNFDQNNLSGFPLSFKNPSDLIDLLIKELSAYSENKKNKNIDNSLKRLSELKTHLKRKNYLLVKRNLEAVHKELFEVFKKEKQERREKLLNIISHFENLYEFALKDSHLPVLIKKINLEIAAQKKLFSSLEKYLFLKKTLGWKITEKALILKYVDERLNTAQTYFNQKRYYLADIILMSNEYLLKIVK